MHYTRIPQRRRPLVYIILLNYKIHSCNYYCKGTAEFSFRACIHAISPFEMQAVLFRANAYMCTRDVVRIALKHNIELITVCLRSCVQLYKHDIVSMILSEYHVPQAVKNDAYVFCAYMCSDTDMLNILFKAGANVCVSDPRISYVPEEHRTKALHGPE